MLLSLKNDNRVVKYQGREASVRAYVRFVCTEAAVQAAFQDEQLKLKPRERFISGSRVHGHPGLVGLFGVSI